MSRSRLLFALLLPLLLLTMAFRQAPLIDPPPINVPAGINDVQVAKSIRAALLGRGWTVSGEQPGAIDSTLHLREHVAQIHITYDTRQIKITYVRSENLKYEVERNGQRLIHKNYLSWVQYLVGDIGRNMELLSSATAGNGH